MNLERSNQVNKASESNAFLSRGVLQRKCDCGNYTQSGEECTACSNKKFNQPLQAKLQIGETNDRYEQEADHVAEQVMRMPNPKSSDANEYLQAKPLVQRQVSNTQSRATEVPSIVNDVLRSQGQPLDQVTREFMEPRFGHDFSAVRIHYDTKAIESAQTVNAKAYTVGKNIVFGKDQYAVGNVVGMRLLAHELTHVVQQEGSTEHKEQTVQKFGEDKMLAGVGITSNGIARTRPSTHSYSSTPKLSKLMPKTAHLQRSTADPSLAPTMTCVVDASPGHTAGTDIMFGSADRTPNDATDIAAITAFHTAWLAGGGIDSIIIDGFASTEGGQRANWQLSCDRAEAVKTSLIGLGVPTGMITTIAHGESTEFSTSSRPPNRRAIIHTRSGIVPTVIITPVMFGSTINRVPPGVGTPVVVLVTGVPAGRTIALDIQGSGGANGTATVAPASIASTSAITVTGGTQTTPGNANNLMVRARIGGRTLATSSGFTVAAHPRDFRVTFNRDINTAAAVGVRANNAWTSDGSGGVPDLTEVERSEQVDILTRDNPPFTSASGTTATRGTSGFIPGTSSPTVDTHTYGVASISRPFWLGLLGNNFRIIYEQLFIFNDRRMAVTNQVVPNSGFTITHTLTWNARRSGWDHQCVKSGAATSVGAFSTIAGSGRAPSLVHPM